MSTLRTDNLQTTDSSFNISVSSLANVAGLSSSTDLTKGAALVGRVSQLVTSLSQLRGLSKTSASTSATFTAHNATYNLDLADTSSPEQVPATIVATDGGRWKLRTDDFYDPRLFGVTLDGVTDDTAAWNLATNYNIKWPPLTSRVTGPVFRGTNTHLKGTSRTASKFLVGTDFNMSATGVIVLTGGETAAQVTDVGVVFTQANQAVRNSCTKYPPAFYINAQPRFLIDNIRIENAWDGITITGNSGGGYIGFIEVGALNKGLQLSGAADFMHGGHWHFWPFGIVDKGTLYNSVYSDQTTIAAEIGNNDGVNIDSISTFGCRLVMLNSASTVLPVHLGMFQCDGNGSGLRSLGGQIKVGLMYSTKLNTSTAASVYASGTAEIEIGQLRLSTSSTVPDINTFDSSVIKINGGTLQLSQPGAQPVRTDGGTIILDGVRFEPQATNYTQPHAVQAAGVLQLKNCTWSPAAGLTGTGVSFVSDDTNNMLETCALNGWAIGLPPSSSGLLGDYSNVSGSSNGDYIGNHFIGVHRTRILIVSADASGNYTGPHGIANAQFRVLRAVAIRRGGAGEASFATITAIDGANVMVTGGTASNRLRIVIDYMTTQDAW